MIVIDTNVVSELMRLTPSPTAMAWFSGQDSAGLYLTAVSEAELRTALRQRRRQGLCCYRRVPQVFGPAHPRRRLPDRRHSPC